MSVKTCKDIFSSVLQGLSLTESIQGKKVPWMLIFIVRKEIGLLDCGLGAHELIAFRAHYFYDYILTLCNHKSHIRACIFCLWPTLSLCCSTSRALIAEMSVQSAATPRAVTPTSSPTWALEAVMPSASPRTNSVATCPTWSTTKRTAPSSTPAHLSPPPRLLPHCPQGTWVSSDTVTQIGDKKALLDEDSVSFVPVSLVNYSLMLSVTFWPILIPQMSLGTEVTLQTDGWAVFPESCWPLDWGKLAL